ncbi:hypothetical protein ACXIVK_00220 [Paraburkholderia caledonica]
MSIRVGKKISAGERRFLVAVLAVVVIAELAGWGYVRYEHHKRDQWFCATRALDTSSCEKLMEANRRSWGE